MLPMNRPWGWGDDSTLTARFYADLTDVNFTDPVADNPFENSHPTIDRSDLPGGATAARLAVCQ